jgi:hypothetical protein
MLVVPRQSAASSAHPVAAKMAPAAHTSTRILELFKQKQKTKQHKTRKHKKKTKTKIFFGTFTALLGYFTKFYQDGKT